MSDDPKSDEGPIELAPRAAEGVRRAGAAVREERVAAKPAMVKKVAAPRVLWEAPEEAGGWTWVVMMGLVGVLALYGWGLSCWYSGAHGGVDQNGYLMTARLITGEKNVDAPAGPAEAAGASEHHPLPAGAQRSKDFEWLRNRLSFVPSSPFEFAGRMCVMTEPFGPAEPVAASEPAPRGAAAKAAAASQAAMTAATAPANYRIYAKYPPGFPVLAAIARAMGGWAAMYLVNPVCTLLACYFAYFLFRQAVGPFMSLLGVVWLACNPLVVNYANDANSHASTLFCVTVGMWGLVSWLRVGGLLRGVVGGLALGYACTIRYSEFLLVLPVVFAAAARVRWERRAIAESLAVVAAWALPVGILAGVCWACYGLPWKTGYTYCNESTGFGWKYLSGDMGDAAAGKQGNWETLLLQLNRSGLFVMWPFAVAGLFGMAASAWRLGWTMLLWVMPATALYMLYYWAPTGETTVGYLRFFMSVMPGFILAGLWVIERGLLAVKGQRAGGLAMLTVAGAGAILAAALAAGGEAPVIGLGFFGQAARELWRLMAGADGRWAAGLGWALAAMTVGVWVFERERVAGRAALAVGAGALTALGCAVNLYNIAPTVEAAHARWVGLRETVDLVRARLPRGTAVFTGTTRYNDQLLNQLDAVGGYELYSATMFEAASFADARRRVDTADKEGDGDAEPDPVQVERERFYMELLGKKNPKGEWVAKSPEELREAAFALQDALLAGGHRVAFLSADGSKGMFPLRPGWKLAEVTRWAAPPEVLSERQARAQAKALVPKHATAFIVLYELEKPEVRNEK